MSRVPASWSMMPAAMNSDALKVAWFMMWKIAATAASGVPSPEQQHHQADMADGRIGQESLEVLLEQRQERPDQERGRARSRSTIRTTYSWPAITGHSRASRNTPAFTIVAECR